MEMLAARIGEDHWKSRRGFRRSLDSTTMVGGLAATGIDEMMLFRTYPASTAPVMLPRITYLPQFGKATDACPVSPDIQLSRIAHIAQWKLLSYTLVSGLKRDEIRVIFLSGSLA